MRTAPPPEPETAEPSAATGAAARQFITFTIDAQEFGIDIMLVREIKGWVETTSLPQAPAYVRGVINLRGIIVPIFDLRARFGRDATVPSRMHVVIIVAVGSRTTGLLVDSVSDIIAVEREQVRPVPDIGLPAEEHFLEGLVALGDRMVTLVNLEGLLRIGDTRTDLLPAAA
jgi:purine-binding chemotaxis protein CheW